MQISLKTGKDLTCDYTGEQVDVLVRLSVDRGDPPPPMPFLLGETLWLSRKALEDALRVIGSLDGGGAPRAAVQPQAAPICPQAPTGPAEAVAAPVQAPQVPEGVVRSFDAELVRLIKAADREEPEDGKKKGLREIHLRELVMRCKVMFRPYGATGQNAMYRVLNLRIGMAKDRFDIMWAQKPQRDVDGIEEDEA